VKNNLTSTLLLSVGMFALSATADGVREDELTISSDALREEVDGNIDLRDRWPVETLGEIDLPYSSVGWDLTPQPAGAAVRLNLLDGAFIGSSFSPGTDSRDLATGLTGTGTYSWIPSGVEKKVYRILHETTRGGAVVDGETFCAYFDFANCEMVTAAEFRGAVLGVTQPVTPADDIRHPWSRIGGDGDGVRNAADGAVLTFAFTGAGTFAAELLFTAGSVTVALDGETVATVSANTQWTEYAWPVVDYDAHTLTLTYSGAAGVNVRGCALTSAVSSAVDQRETAAVTCDLRATFPVAKLENEPMLQDLTYSALGWERNAAADATRTVTITARSGTLADGVFTPDGSAEMTVLAATTGRGTFNWQVTDISKKLYQLTHTVKKSGAVDATAYLYGYLDFTHCAIWASQADVEASVLDAITHTIAVGQDADWPWQPIDSAAVRSGIETEATLEEGEETATTFTFKGRGVLRYAYDLTGGQLEVVADGETVSTFTAPTADWTACTVTFTGYGAHEVAFVFTAGGAGGTAALKNVRWEETEVGSRAEVGREGVPVDLQEGVRTAKYLTDILPFQYSSTNWIGDVTGATDASVARVTIVRLMGTDPDVRNWTTEVPSTFRVLKAARGEGEAKWMAHVGVWKATFDILNTDQSIHQEIAIFDLRGARPRGFFLRVR